MAAKGQVFALLLLGSTVACQGSAVQHPSGQPGHWSSADSSPTSRIVRLHYVSGGGTDPQNPCYEKPTVRVQESVHEVSIRLWIGPPQGPFGDHEGCGDIAQEHSIKVELKRPLGERKIVQ